MFSIKVYSFVISIEEGSTAMTSSRLLQTRQVGLEAFLIIQTHSPIGDFTIEPSSYYNSSHVITRGACQSGDNFY